jgi:hypothetical protein
MTPLRRIRASRDSPLKTVLVRPATRAAIGRGHLKGADAHVPPRKCSGSDTAPTPPVIRNPQLNSAAAGPLLGSRRARKPSAKGGRVGVFHDNLVDHKPGRNPLAGPNASPPERWRRSSPTVRASGRRSSRMTARPSRPRWPTTRSETSPVFGDPVAYKRENVRNIQSPTYG